jgi:ABC-2 type transport system permease protein
MQKAVAAYDASGLSNASSVFFYNASSALNQSIDATEDAHARLLTQTDELNKTVITLDGSILALETIKSAVGDNITKAALDANIAGLKALRGNTLQQIQDAQNQTTQLEDLNRTLQGMRASLTSYEKQVGSAEQGQAKLSAGLSLALLSMNASFSQAKGTVGKLETLFSEINSTTASIEKTLDVALEHIDDVEELITSLQKTVAEQTGKDPETLAAPLSVKVENQYARSSFVDFIIPQVIAVSLLFSCFLLASISLVREKSSRTIVRLLMMPGALANAVAAKVAFVTLVSLGQVAIILLVAVLLFGVQPPSDIVMLAAGTAVSALVLSAIGMLIGFYARSESAAIQTSLLIAIPMLFLGNIIFSPDLLPAYTQVLLQLLPLAHITNIFKVVLITNGDPTADMAALLSYFVLLALAVVAIVWKRRDITNYV